MLVLFFLVGVDRKFMSLNDVSLSIDIAVFRVGANNNGWLAALILDELAIAISFWLLFLLLCVHFVSLVAVAQDDVRY